MIVRAAERSDVPQLVACWNEMFEFDRVDERKFERVVFDDVNYAREATLIAEQNGRTDAFTTVVVRRAMHDPEGNPRPIQEDRGYLKGICYRDEAGGAELLHRACEFLRSKGKTTLRVVEYGGGSYFFPGIDLRYASLLEFMKRHAFEQVRELQDVALDLAANPPGEGEYQRRQWAKFRSTGLRIADYSSGMLSAARTFAPALGIPTWFEPGWDVKWADGQTIVALDGEKVVGFARYHTDSRAKAAGGLGPIGTLESHRGRGVGSCMLDECMRRLKAAGCTTAVADWANTPFYLKNGWTVSRRYAVLQKDL